MQPHDAITLESHSDSIGWSLSSVCELEGSQSHLHKPPRLKGAQQPTQGWVLTLFIAPKLNRAVSKVSLFYEGTGQGGAPPTVKSQRLIWTSHWAPGTGHRVVVHRPRGDSDHPGQPPKTALSREKRRCHHRTVWWPWRFPIQLKTKNHQIKLVDHFISFPKSHRSSKSEFGAKSYAQNTKGWLCWFGHAAAGGGGALCLGWRCHRPRLSGAHRKGRCHPPGRAAH
jgi:hypothetical protein